MDIMLIVLVVFAGCLLLFLIDRIIYAVAVMKYLKGGNDEK